MKTEKYFTANKLKPAQSHNFSNMQTVPGLNQTIFGWIVCEEDNFMI